MNETRRIAQFVCRTDYEDLPPDVVNSFKIFVLDTFAAGFIGSLLPWAKIVLARVKTRVGPRYFSVLSVFFRQAIVLCGISASFSMPKSPP